MTAASVPVMAVLTSFRRRAFGTGLNPGGGGRDGHSVDGGHAMVSPARRITSLPATLTMMAITNSQAATTNNAGR